jgi:transposase-like protein
LPLQTTAVRLWKRLTPQERLEAGLQFWKEPPSEAAGSALGAIVQARRMRPQAARSLPEEQKARALAQVLDPGETVAAALVVALHLGSRRTMLAAFLDALSIPHDDGILKEEAVSLPPASEEQARAAVRGLAARFPTHEVEVYLNALWLQDPERWGVLEDCAEWLPTEAAAPSQAQ